MKKLGLLSTIAAVALMTQGCAHGMKAKPHMAKKVKQYNNSGRYSINVKTTSKIADTVDTIAQQLFDTMRAKHINNIGSIAITSFVDLDQLNKTTRFGRVVGESFFNALDKRGVRVMDLRGQKALTINGSGEFFLSRNIKKLHSPLKNKYVLVGTYAKIQEGVLINSRVIDNATGEVIASSRVVFASDDCKLFESCVKPKPEPVVTVRTLSLTTDGCSTEKCPCNGYFADKCGSN